MLKWTFETSTAERNVAHRIARRAWAAFTETTKRSIMDYEMDIIATHANGCPLRLEALAEADAFNFAHDILGIERHLNRETAQLENGFTPRYALPMTPASVDPGAEIEKAVFG